MIQKIVLLLCACIMLLSGCGSSTEESSSGYITSAPMDDVSMENEMAALSTEPALPTYTVPTASGVQVSRNDRAEIDYSNTADGYVMVRFTGSTDKRLKAQVIGPTTTYTYDLTPGEAWTTFSLSDGNGSYKIALYENTTGSKYATVLSETIQVQLTDEFAPFLCSNQYVDYVHAPNTVRKAEELIGAVEDPLEQVAVVYDYIIQSMRYDYDLASTVQSGYLPVLDTVLEQKTGICFDYAALMTGMLRSQGLPCKLVVGYAGDIYHAWISIWTAETGWIDGAVYFDGTSWTRMDPTFADTGDQSKEIMEFIDNDNNYTVKYLY